MVTSIVEMDIDNQLEEEELKEQIRLNEKLAAKEGKEDRLKAAPDHTGIAVGRFSSLIRPENSQPSRLGIISLGSGSEKEKPPVAPSTGTDSKLK